MPPLLARARRLLVTGALILALLVLAGATYQGAATALERRHFPHPGRLIDVGGHQLHLYCIGRGTPAVVLEAPATGMSAAWGWVQPDVARVTRVCAYDRAGLGWSESGRDYEPAAVPSELHALLKGAGERGPYVVAGQGLGAALARLYAANFGSEVAALVLVDPPATGGGPQRTTTTRFLNASPWLARTGVLRATRMMSSNASGLPDVSAGPLSAFLNRPDHLTRAAAELERWDEAVELAARAALSPGIQVANVSAASSGPTALLTDQARGTAVAAAITAAVEHARARAGSSDDPTHLP